MNINSYIKNYGKLLAIYDLENKTLIKDLDIITNDDILKNPKYILCFKIINKEDFLHNNLNISLTHFPWKTYFKLNNDLVSPNDTNTYNKITAWNHWINFGKREERAFSYINNTNNHRGRFGNIFFVNMCLHFFSIKYNLKCNYKHEKQFNKLGIYFNKGQLTYNRNLLLTDYNFENLLESDISPKNIIIDNNVWFHTKRFCTIINKYFIDNKLFDKILDSNYYKMRYNKNNDLFIHVRLGDVESKTLCLYNYYKITIQSTNYKKGYISSDNINHPMCQKLIKKFNLEIINKNETETIMFASTCNNIILTGGTFSWLIGFLASKSKNIYYPQIKEKWFGDIFSFSNWTEFS
jgi:hypothetical protein